jgi:hypothetical protein
MALLENRPFLKKGVDILYKFKQRHANIRMTIVLERNSYPTVKSNENTDSVLSHRYRFGL